MTSTTVTTSATQEYIILNDIDLNFTSTEAAPTTENDSEFGEIETTESPYNIIYELSETETSSTAPPTTDEIFSTTEKLAVEVVNWARKIKGNKKDWQAFLDGTSTTDSPSTTTDYATTTIPVSTSIITTVTTSMPATARNPKFNTNTGLDRNSSNRKNIHNSASRIQNSPKPVWAEKLVKPETRPLLERPVETQRAEVNDYDDYSAKPILPGTVAMAVKEVTEPERTTLPIDEPIVVQSEDKSAITFYPSLLKETFNQLPGLSKLEVTQLLSKFLSEYKVGYIN